ncbi:MAG TPA: hypothetical protein VHN77_00690 [Phycisphaerales bacterium]|nr:hypothetical protein [Phycisphaerales bacterium]
MNRLWNAAVAARGSNVKTAVKAAITMSVATGVAMCAGTAHAQYAQVVSFSRTVSGSASAVAGPSTNGPIPLASSANTWTALPFGTLIAPAIATAPDAVCGPNGVLSQGTARVDQFVGITSADHFEIASTVYGIANVSAHPCTTLSGSGDGATSCSWNLVFNALAPTTLSLTRANAAVAAGNSSNASATTTYTITGPSGVVVAETLTAPLPTGSQNAQGPIALALQPGQYTVAVTAQASMQGSGTATTAVGGTAYAGFDLTFRFGAGCDSIDFNADGLFPDTADIDDFLSVFSGGPCSNDPNCGDIDFNNDGLFPDTLDIDAFLSVFSGGACLA